MRLQELFEAGDLIVGLEASDKWEALDRMLDHLVTNGRVSSGAVEEFREAVLARERSMSTGMEHGIAIPHAAVEGLDHVVGCLAILQNSEGLNFESIDASPTFLICLLLIPRSQKLLHIRTLADVARALGNEETRNALFEASGSDEAWRALA